MRMLLALVVLTICDSGEPRPAIAAKPEPAPASPPVSRFPLADGDQGWCPPSAWSPRHQITRSFEVAQDLTTQRPMRNGGFDSYAVGHDRDARPQGMYTWRRPTIVDGKLQLSTYPTSCHETGAGCYAGYWSVPAAVVLVDPKPVTGCISYAFELRNGVVVGIGTEIRTFLRRGETPRVGPRMSAPDLQVLDMLEGPIAVATAADHTLWTVTWSGTRRPVFAQAAKLPSRVRAVARDHGLTFVFTDAGLHAFDDQWTERWHLDGEAWTVMSLDVPLTHYVLMVERGAVPRVVLRMLDENGAEGRRKTIFSGEVTEARLERSGTWVNRDRWDPILVVHLAQ